MILFLSRYIHLEDTQEEAQYMSTKADSSNDTLPRVHYHIQVTPIQKISPLATIRNLESPINEPNLQTLIQQLNAWHSHELSAQKALIQVLIKYIANDVTSQKASLFFKELDKKVRIPIQLRLMVIDAFHALGIRTIQ